MVYLGRILFGGLTREGKDACIYGVTVRSEPNKARKAIPASNYRIFIGSSLTEKPYYELSVTEKEMLREYISGKIPHNGVSALVKDLTEENKALLGKQMDDEDLIFYDGIVVDKSFAFLSNGLQTDDICKTIELEGPLNKWGPELDGPGRTPQTPRIGGIAHIGGFFELGFISRQGEAKTLKMDSSRRKFYGVSTYAGDPKDPRNMVIPYVMPVHSLDTNGRTAQELADELYDWLDPNFVVCTASALRDGNRWQLAVRNLHE